MFATPLTACPATRVKSVPMPAVPMGAPVDDWALGALTAVAVASASLALRKRPVTTRPAAKPATTNAVVSRSRRMDTSL